MKKMVKLLLGIVAVLPLLLFFVFVTAIILWLQFPSKEVIEWILTHPVHLIFINIGLLLMSIGPLVFYVVHAGLNPGLADRKGPWILLMVFLGAFMMPLCWYQFVWHDSFYEVPTTT